MYDWLAMKTILKNVFHKLCAGLVQRRSAANNPYQYRRRIPPLGGGENDGRGERLTQVSRDVDGQ